MQFVRDIRSLSPQKKPETPVPTPAAPSSFSATKNSLLDTIIPMKGGPKALESDSSGASKKLPTRNLFIDEEAPKPVPKAAPEIETNYVSTDEPLCLAFSSISTALGHFDKTEAAEIVKDTVETFLQTHPQNNLRLVMVVDPEEPESYSVLKKLLVSDSRFSVILGDISKVRTKHGIMDCGFVGIEATWRLQAGGTAANKKVHQAAGKLLQEEAKRLYQAGKVGVSYPVKLPSDCPLTLAEGVHQVINVVGPNFNPDRPDVIEDRARGAALLRQAYEELFKCFFKLTNLPPAKTAMSSSSSSSSTSATSTTSSGNGAHKAGESSSSAKGGWSNALYAYVDHPEKQGAAVYHFDKDTVTIFDKYPKAQKHFLIMPRSHIDGIDVLKPADIPTLESMKTRAELIIRA